MGPTSSPFRKFVLGVEMLSLRHRIERFCPKTQRDFVFTLNTRYLEQAGLLNAFAHEIWRETDVWRPRYARLKGDLPKREDFHTDL